MTATSATSQRRPFLPPADVSFAMEKRARQAHPAPSDAQKKAGNYRMGHIRVGGLAITIENPRGSIRRGESNSGHKWAVQMPAHYGYFRGFLGADGEPLDVIVGPHLDSQLVFVVDQCRYGSDGAAFDEHKVVMGTKSEREAKLLYLSCYSPGWKGFVAITPMTLPQFKVWAAGHPLKPASAVALKKSALDGVIVRLFR